MSIESEGKAYRATEDEFNDALSEHGFVPYIPSVAFWGAADQYIYTLEARVLELEARLAGGWDYVKEVRSVR